MPADGLNKAVTSMRLSFPAGKINAGCYSTWLKQIVRYRGNYSWAATDIGDTYS